MARRLCNCTPRGTSLALVVLCLLVVIHRIDGYPHGRPSVNRESERSPRSLENNNRNGPVPSCRNLTFCIDTPYYPSDYVDSLLSMNESLKYLATIDVPSTITHRIEEDGEEALCTSKEDVVRPKTALSIDERWLYIVNSDSYMQRVRVEICQSRNTACSMIDGFAEGYKTTCKQMYIYRQLVAISSSGTIMPELFKIPASCKCYVKFTGDPWMRIGVNLGKNNKQSPVPKRRKNRK